MALLNYAFIEGRLGDIIKKGLIKPIPKQVACSQLKHWRPITMLTTIYKLLAKMLAMRMTPILSSIVSPHQHGFIKGRNIYDNILTAMVGMEYVQFTKQECVLLQLDLDKAYDRITWSFVSEVLKKFGCGPRIYNAIYAMGAGSSSAVLFNTVVVGEFQIKRSIW